MLAIHNSQAGFHARWVAYCEKQGIPFKRVDCYANDLIAQLVGCTALMWHHSHGNPKDILIAKQILFALEHTGFQVFPDFRTAWHFDDKVAQKYLLERLGAPLVPSYVFFNQKEAFHWANGTTFPKVWKLRGGAGSANVQLVRDKAAAIRKIKRAFGRGFPAYDSWGSLRERWRRFRQGQAGAVEVLKGLGRLVYPPVYSRIAGRERGYVYFQDFIPGNPYDIRVVVIGNRAFAIKRLVRPNDFRASGGGAILYEKNHFDLPTIKLAFDIAFKLKSQCVAFDFVYHSGRPLVVEISYGFSHTAYDKCTGYWDEHLIWHEDKVYPQEWMIEEVIKKI